MNFPLEIGIGNFKLSAHLLFETLAFVLGFRYYLHLRKGIDDRISESNRIWIILGAAFGAFLFSRLFGALEDPQAWFDSEHPLLHFFQNKTIVGGLLGGLIGVEGIKMLIGERESSGDLFTFPLILAMMIGRIGCLSSGIYEATYGIETSLPWGLDLGDGLSRHPVALYEIVFLGMLWIFLKFIQKKYRLKNGNIFKLFMINYFIFRFLIELIKPSYFYDFGMSSIQIFCLMALVYYSKTIFRVIFKSNKLMPRQAP